MKLKTKFIFLGAASIATLVVMEYLSIANMHKMVDYTEDLHEVSQVTQRHMQTDMMHDAMRGDFYEAMLAHKNNNPAGVQNALKSFNEHSADFVKNLEESLKSNNEPADIRDGFDKIAAGLKEYDSAGRAAIAALVQNGDPSVAENAFMQSFGSLEAAMEEQSTRIENWAIAFVQDGKATAQRDEQLLMIVGLMSLLVAIAVPLNALFGVFRPQHKLTEVMNRLADGEVKIDVPYTHRSDEIGAIAKALLVFRRNAEDKIRMQQEQEMQKAASEQQKKQAMLDLATQFENSVKGVVDTVASAATEMDATANSVAKIADSSQQKLSALTIEIGGAVQNVQNVASSSGELTSAINEISSQVTRATHITNSAVAEAGKADQTVQGLSVAAQSIGEVLEMINGIAEQINLLALNATIEAARAGDAGKGFAVVASEVKNLANQTTKATGEIAGFIRSMQSATSETVDVIKGIGHTIREINNISTAIAAAVEEQGVATQQIASNIREASHGTDNVSRNVTEVMGAASETGNSAREMTAAASELSRQSEHLRSEVDNFIRRIRNG